MFYSLRLVFYSNTSHFPLLNAYKFEKMVKFKSCQRLNQIDLINVLVATFVYFLDRFNFFIY